MPDILKVILTKNEKWSPDCHILPILQQPMLTDGRNDWVKGKSLMLEEDATYVFTL